MPDTNNMSSSQTMIERVYNVLKEDILNGVLAPESKLKVEQLRAKFDASSSTVREALSRLMAETLVTTERQRGFKVASLSLTDFKSISQTRKILEIEALRISLANADDKWEAQLVAAYHQLSKIENQLATGEREKYFQIWDSRNKEFHDALIAACQNDWILRFRNLLHLQSTRYIRLALMQKSESRDVRKEHKAIYNAALKRDEQRACQQLALHIDRTVKVIEERLSETMAENEMV